MSSLENLDRFARLPPGRRQLLLRAACWVVAVRLALWLVPFRILWGLSRRKTAKPPPTEPVSPADLAWAVRTAGRYVPGATCLTQALALHGLLRRAGHSSRIRIGVAKTPQGRLTAHAWVEGDHSALAVGPDAGQFTPLRGLAKELA
jgi:hypothetical protein